MLVVQPWDSLRSGVIPFHFLRWLCRVSHNLATHPWLAVFLTFNRVRSNTDLYLLCRYSLSIFLQGYSCKVSSMLCFCFFLYTFFFFVYTGCCPGIFFLECVGHLTFYLSTFYVGHQSYFSLMEWRRISPLDLGLLNQVVKYWRDRYIIFKDLTSLD